MEVPDSPLNNGVSKSSYRHSLSESEVRIVSLSFNPPFILVGSDFYTLKGKKKSCFVQGLLTVDVAVKWKNHWMYHEYHYIVWKWIFQ